MTNEKNLTIMGGVTVPSMPSTADPQLANVRVKKEDLDDAGLAEAVFIQAEENLMEEDEEVTSVESNGAVEDTMFTMALMNSVADQRGSGSPEPQPDPVESRLRKRPRSQDHHDSGSAVPNPLQPPRALPNTLMDPGLLSPPSPSGHDPAGEPKRRVCFEEPTSRLRSFSIDLDLASALELGDDSNGGNDSIPGGRSRTFSFECFAFDPSLDEHAVPSSVAEDFSRPRGDSLIFDPTSFQDGGIHEQTALSRHINSSPPAPDIVSSSRSPPLVKSAEIAAPKVTAFTANSSSGVASSGATLPMDLINKGGRIGIYLPEARRARIARFHAKRSKRVWRKRIKYDCRKKLADSRPRVKGRFVKRAN